MTNSAGVGVGRRVVGDQAKESEPTKLLQDMSIPELDDYLSQRISQIIPRCRNPHCEETHFKMRARFQDRAFHRVEFVFCSCGEVYFNQLIHDLDDIVVAIYRRSHIGINLVGSKVLFLG